MAYKLLELKQGPVQALTTGQRTHTDSRRAEGVGRNGSRLQLVLCPRQPLMGLYKVELYLTNTAKKVAQHLCTPVASTGGHRDWEGAMLYSTVVTAIFSC